MASIFRKPKMNKMGLKILGYGDTGTGKSTFVLTFPSLAIIDSEAGMSLYEDSPNIVMIANTSSCYDVEDAISEIEDNLDSIATFAIDSETKVYDNMQVSAMEVEREEGKKKGGEIEDSIVSMRGHGRIKLLNKRIQNLKISLSSKGCNIVSIAQMEDIKEKRGENFVKIGDKPVMAKNVQYDYDIVIKFFTETTSKGEVYKGLIEKDRTKIYKKGDIIENPSYNSWAEYFKGNVSLDSTPINYNTDVDRDMGRMDIETNAIDKIVAEFKEAMKVLAPAQKNMVMKKLKELGIDNPLSTVDVEGMKEISEFIKTLS